MDPYQIGAAALAGLSIGLLAWWGRESFDSLVASGASRSKTAGGELREIAKPQRRFRWFQSAVLALIPVVEERRRRAGVKDLLTRIEAGLLQAGRQRRENPVEYLCKSIVIAACAMAGVFALGLLFRLPAAADALILAPLSAIIAVAVRVMILEREASNRTTIIDRRLPFATEFLLMVMQASGTFQSGVATYIEQVGDDPLADEFRVMRQELGLKVDQETALLNVAERVNSIELRNFITAVLSGTASGQSMEDAFRIQAESTRIRRYQNAEELAKAASSKATFPLMLIGIAALILLVAPLLMQAFRNGLL